MIKPKKVQFSFSLDPEEKEVLEKAAKDMGITFTELLRKGARFYADLDPEFRVWLMDFSKVLGIPEFLVLQNLAISWQAKKEAQREVCLYKDSRLEEFMFTEKGPLTGKELNHIIKENEKKRLMIGEKKEKGSMNVFLQSLLDQKDEPEKSE